MRRVLPDSSKKPEAPRPGPAAAQPLDSLASDALLLGELKDGNLSALGVLYDRYHVPVYRFISRATGNGHDVEDLVHATFLTASRAAASFDGRANCRPWLLGIASRLVQRRRRGLSRFARALRGLTALEGAPNRDPFREIVARDEVSRLSAALQQLSDAKRMVLLLAEAEGLSSAEIAEALRIPVGTVWTRLHHARGDLRAILDGGPSRDE